jgi:SAM-dependent methyltransferase
MKESEMSLPSKDSDVPEFWNERYATGETPWVMHQIPGALDDFLRRATPGLVLIPGCGNNYEVIRAFDAAGFVVSAIDFSPVALNQAKTALGSLGDRLILGDFFQQDFGSTRFDFVFDRTFLCALNPSRWGEYGARVANLLRPNGSLVGIFFYGHELEPPPFPLTHERATELFGKAFRLRRDDPVTDSIAIFRGQERWQEWQQTQICGEKPGGNEIS